MEEALRELSHDPYRMAVAIVAAGIVSGTVWLRLWMWRRATVAAGRGYRCLKGSTLRLRDGRRLGYRLWGVGADADATADAMGGGRGGGASGGGGNLRAGVADEVPTHTVLYIHGAPGSRHEWHPDTRMLRRRGIRLVTVDRPGYGLSSHRPRGWGYRSFADDVAQLLASLSPPVDLRACHDGGDDSSSATASTSPSGRGVSVIGFSSGAPYAHACVACLPRGAVRSAAIVSGDGPNTEYGAGSQTARAVAAVSPLGAWDAVVATTPVLRWLVWLRVSVDRLRYLADPVGFVMLSFGKRLCGAPGMLQMLLEDWHTAHAESDTGRALMDDVRMEHTPWGWSLERDCGHVAYDVWHGLSDKVVPPDVGRHVAGRLAQAELHLLPSNGHTLHLRPENTEAILDALLAKATRAEATRASSPGGGAAGALAEGARAKY